MTPTSASRLGTSPRTCCARKGSPTSATCRDTPRSDAVGATARSTSSFETAAWIVSHLDAGEPITALAGVHAGCYELFAHEPIRTISDLKGKKVGIPALALGRAPAARDHGGAGRARSPQGHRLGHPGPSATPWSCSPTARSMPFSAFPPEPQELRARKIGRVILNTATDQPWSQYFCCMVFGNRDFVRDHPIATKRVPARHPQGRRHLRRRAGAGRATAGRWRVHRALRLRAPDADRAALRQLARVRPGGLDAVLRAAAPRGRHDQVDPASRSSPRAPTGAS